MKPLLGAMPTKYVSIQAEIDNMIKHREKAIIKMGKIKYNRLLKKLKESL
jgi:hypothetical protein